MQHSAPFIGLTDKAWFDYLTSIAEYGRVDEVNFWSPKSLTPLKRMSPGAPFFLRLKKPHYAVAGYGFYAHFCVLELDAAWDTFAEKNGDPDKLGFFRRIARYRGLDAGDQALPRSRLGCTILRDVHLWPRSRWIAWGSAEGWHDNIVQGKTEADAKRASVLLETIEHDAIALEELIGEFQLVDADERQLVLAKRVRREGQGTFRSRLLDAYGRCAISGERTEPVLDAAHVQPYLGPRSNHPQNGLLLTKELHALFDQGLITVTPEHRVRVSSKIRERWSNGKRFYEFDGKQVVRLPSDTALHPSAAALAWHNQRLFVA